MTIEKIDHKKRKDSTLKWFIIGLIPIGNLYFLWKAAELISGHEKKKYEFLRHKKAKGSTTLWFIFILLFYIFSWIIGASPDFYRMQVGMQVGILVLIVIEIPIGIYILWKVAEVVSGHEKIYKKYEALAHKDKNVSTLLWFIIGIIPIVNLYLLWKVAEAISGHEKIYK